MVKKKIDNRIRVMIENGVKLGHRTMFLLVGDKSRDQVPILYDMLVKSTVKARPTVLWCYKNKDEAISNHGRKRAKKIAAGKLEVSEESLFDSFRVATTIHGRYYSESHSILGKTYGVCVLQDFEALTPNLMARTIETVEGGGLIIFLLKSMASLRQLHSITMDVHARFKTEAYNEVVNRFNVRFLLSLADNPRCLVLDDSLTVLPISSKTAQVEPVDSVPEVVDPRLSALVESLEEAPPAGPLVALCRTHDQALALAHLIDVLADKQPRPPQCLTAARGRGKSACLGLAVAAAVSLGYVNVFVTSPHPDNLGTLFEFVLRGLDAAHYQEHTDYSVVRSTNPDFRKAVVRINIARTMRQTVQYIAASDQALLAAADLVLVDEAGALPLAQVAAAARAAPLAVLASTVSGYEGTGRALSLKLFAQLQKAHGAPPPLRLDEPIRYRGGDAVERWLNALLCLEAAPSAGPGAGAPSPHSCDLYRVDRDALFCYHKAAEAFLQRVVSIYVASHYKNSPNDIQLLADAPAHRLFVLLAPTAGAACALPEVLVVLQLCLEGTISDSGVREAMGRGRKAAGDLIPWNIGEQFQDKDFPKLAGARIVRIATHPSYQRMGYGKRALQQLWAYYSGEIATLDEEDGEGGDGGGGEHPPGGQGQGQGLHSETIAPRPKPPTLLKRLTEARPERLDYIGTSFGITADLLKFWKSQGYMPLYISQKSNEVTGEHSCILLRALEPRCAWAALYRADFARRLSRLLARSLRHLPAALALSALTPPPQHHHHHQEHLPELDKGAVDRLLSGHDVARVEAYCRQQADHHLVADLLQPLADLALLHRAPALALDTVHKVVLVALGYQMKTAEELGGELGLGGAQLLAKLYDACKKIHRHVDRLLQDAVARDIGLDELQPADAADAGAGSADPVKQTLHQELNKAAKELERRQRKELSKLVGEDLAQYRIKGDEGSWSQALAASKHTHLLSVKSGEKRLGEDAKELEELASLRPDKKKKKKKHNKS